MNILLVLIPLSVLLAFGAGIAFFWAVDHDQFDDLDTPKLLPLLDDPHTGPEIGNGLPVECPDPKPSGFSAMPPGRRGRPGT